MLMRRRRPLMRAAMVGGVAYHAGKRSQEGRDEDAERDARLAQLEAEQGAAPPAGGMNDDSQPAPSSCVTPSGEVCWRRSRLSGT